MCYIHGGRHKEGSCGIGDSEVEAGEMLVIQTKPQVACIQGLTCSLKPTDGHKAVWRCGVQRLASLCPNEPTHPPDHLRESGSDLVPQTSPCQGGRQRQTKPTGLTCLIPKILIGNYLRVICIHDFILAVPAFFYRVALVSHPPPHPPLFAFGLPRPLMHSARPPQSCD